MATAIWKGFLTFGLVSIPVRLYRAARPEKVSFRQLQSGTGARVRQALVASGANPAPPADDDDEEITPEEQPAPGRGAAKRSSAEARENVSRTTPFVVPSPAPASSGSAPAPAPPPPSSAPREIARSEVVKGYEYARDQYVVITKEELAAIKPETARDMQILEFVKLHEVDPIYFETSYYVAPDKGGEKAYSLLFEALRRSEFVGVAQVAMHNREHVVIIRPGRRGIVLHTMFYQTEIREADEYHAETSNVADKELNLALLLIKNLEAPFEPAKYHDTYKEKLEALIEARIAGKETVAAPAPTAAPVVNILEALQKSLDASRKPPAKADEAEGASPARQGSATKKRRKA